MAKIFDLKPYLNRINSIWKVSFFLFIGIICCQSFNTWLYT